MRQLLAISFLLSACASTPAPAPETKVSVEAPQAAVVAAAIPLIRVEVAVAFNWEALNAVPTGTLNGADQVMVGVSGQPHGSHE